MSYKSLAQRILSALMFSLVLLVMSFGVVWAEEPQVLGESQLASFAGTVNLVTRGSDGAGVYADHNTRCCGMADDGSFLFISNAQNLVAPPTALVENRLYLFDNATKVITLLPKFGNLAPQTAQISSNKEWIVVQTTAETVFIYNTVTFELFPVVKSDGTQITNIDWFDVTADASVVALSTMLKLDPADTNSKYDLYLWSRATKATQLVSKKGDGTAAGIERPVEISQDSGFVSYIGAGSNFPACGTKAEDIYRRNVSTDEITCVTEGITDNYEEFFNSFQMSTDGNVFLFNGLKYVGVNPESTNLYLVDLTNGTAAATLFDTVEFDKLNFYKLSADGSTVVYTKGAFNTPATPKEYCTYAVATATHSCVAAPTGVRDGDFGMISPTARYTIISAWDHQWIGSTVENKKNQAYHDDLFIWDKEGVNNTISGHVTGDDGVTGLPGVMLTNGTGEQYVTDATGQYSMPYLTAAQLYEVTPSMSGKTFYPASKLVTVPTSGSVDFSTRNPVKSVVVFIPGIGGSQLRTDTELAPDWYVWPVYLDLRKKLMSLKPGNREDSIYTDDVIRVYDAFNFPINPPWCNTKCPHNPIYGPFLEELTNQSYVEYQTSGHPERRRLSGCDTSQTNANLFIFPWDWRFGAADAVNPDGTRNADLSLDTNNVELLREFILCIKQVHPTAQITLVSHSMGWFIGRTYVLNYPSDHSVTKHIAIAPPRLGASKAIAIMLNGNWLPIIGKDRARSLLEYFPGGHQLLPSELYWQIAGASPFKVNMLFPAGSDGSVAFSDFQEKLQQHYISPDEGILYQSSVPFVENMKEVYKNPAFASLQGDSSGVEYHIIYGVQQINNTIGTVKEKPLWTYNPTVGLDDRYDFEMTEGDGTVAVLSATAGGGNLNGSATLHEFIGNAMEHQDMMSERELQQCVFVLLADSPCEGQITSASAANMNARYLRLWGVAALQVTDGISMTENIMTNTLSLGMFADITANYMGDDSIMLTIAGQQQYTITFTAQGELFEAQATYGTGTELQHKLRFNPQPTAEQGLSLLSTEDTSLALMKIDTNGDGSADTVIDPVANLTQSHANDAQGPNLTVTHTITSGLVVTATDELSGIARILYSTDATHFTEYTTPVRITDTSVTNATVIAEDKAGNMTHVTVNISLVVNPQQEIFLPLVRR